jgi:thioredoxin 1
VRDVTDESFERDVLQADGPVIVDFWAPWCGPCKAIEPALEEIADASERVELVRIDIDANPRTADRYGVLSIPTVTLFAGGEARATVYGARPKKHFVKTFAAYL